jgi:hypothetical protein
VRWQGATSPSLRRALHSLTTPPWNTQSQVLKLLYCANTLALDLRSHTKQFRPDSPHPLTRGPGPSALTGDARPVPLLLSDTDFAPSSFPLLSP